MIRWLRSWTQRPVALLAEGVDRNDYVICWKTDRIAVALLAEGVDRNLSAKEALDHGNPSPSSRRAWIEIVIGVMVQPSDHRRPPRGGRG